MTDSEIERMTLCIAQMAATLEAGDHANKLRIISSAFGYAQRARELYEEAAKNVAGPWPTEER